MAKVTGELATVLQGIRSGDIDNDAGCKEIVKLKGKGRITHLVNTLAGFGLVDRVKMKLTKAGEECQPQPEKKPPPKDK